MGLRTYPSNLAMEAHPIHITINGEQRHVPSGQSVASLLKHLEIGADRIAGELNKAIVRKRDWEHTPVTGGAQIEIVEFVGGG
jgi:thiamine biosynthesis protein ThiS